VERVQPGRLARMGAVANRHSRLRRLRVGAEMVRSFS
jgi:hypothetical protein